MLIDFSMTDSPKL